MTVKTNIHYDQNMEPMITETRGEVAHVEKPTITSAEKRELLSIVPNVAKSGDGRVTIIILAWNQLRYTKICIESIKRLTDRNRYDLVLVDNGSTDKTIEYLKTVLDGNRDIVISNATNRGFSGGNNQGLKVAESEYILMLNNDCRIEKDNWLDILFYESEGKNIGLVGALCHKAAPDYARKMFDHIGAGRESDKWSYIEGWCIFGKRELFVKLDGFDMRFNPAYGEDADLSYRVKELGLKIKAVKLPIKHFGNKSKSQLDRSIPHQSDKSGRRMFSKWIKESSDFELLAPTPLSTVCFRAIPKSISSENELNNFNKKLMDNINATGKTFLSHTVLNGKFTIRVVVSGIRTEAEHVKEVFEILNNEFNRLAK